MTQDKTAFYPAKAGVHTDRLARTRAGMQARTTRIAPPFLCLHLQVLRCTFFLQSGAGRGDTNTHARMHSRREKKNTERQQPTTESSAGFFPRFTRHRSALAPKGYGMEIELLFRSPRNRAECELKRLSWSKRAGAPGGGGEMYSNSKGPSREVLCKCRIASTEIGAGKNKTRRHQRRQSPHHLL